jgi:hypothetical protein
MKSLKQVIGLIICLVVLIGSVFIGNQSALAEFKRGTAHQGYHSQTTIVLDRTFGEPGGYIRERELRHTTPFHEKVNLYDGHEKKIGYAKKDYRSGGINTYDKNGKKTGYYRNRL